jgi:hypothetical protein
MSERKAKGVMSEDAAMWWGLNVGKVIVTGGRYFLVSSVALGRQEVCVRRDIRNNEIQSITYGEHFDVEAGITELAENEATAYHQVNLDAERIDNRMLHLLNNS